MIETREQLADALAVAAALEHGLLLQYLFAAYSLKKTPDENITWPQAELCRQWEFRLLRVAHEEMAHLGTVCNLLSAIGEAPHFRRPNFPQPPSPACPFDLELTRYSDEALYRFVRAEQPSGMPRPARPAGAPALGLAALVAQEPILFDTTGQLYEQIELGFAHVSNVIIGPAFAQDTSDWSNRFSIPNISTVQGALDAMNTIVRQGEGSPNYTQPSHYQTFLDLRTELSAAGPFEPARPVASNPRVNAFLIDAPGGTPIVDPLACKVGDLFNEVYETVLLMLMQYYSYSGETPAQRVALREAIRTSMSMSIRPIAEVLTCLPIGDGSARTAGPGFELATDLRLSTQPPNRWTILDDRFTANAAAARELGGANELTGRLDYVGENIALIASNLRKAAS